MKKREILLILSEENPSGLKAIVSTLEDMGHYVTTGMNSEFPSESLRKKDFDLVMTDRLDVLKKTKEISPETTVIILTANDKVTFVIIALRLGADDYIIKPLSLIELRHLVAHYLEKSERKRRVSQSKLREDTLSRDILNMSRMMSHDVKGSLVSILATLKLIARGFYGKMDEGVANSLKEVLSKIVCLMGVTEEYLGRTFSINNLEPNEVLDLMQDVIHPVLDELSPELKEHCVRFDHGLDMMFNKRIPIKASRIGLKAVFRNLLKNAIKHGDKGGTIAIGLEGHGSSYRMNVYNTGKTIPEEYRNVLFREFVSFRHTGNGGTDGTGLGLYLVKEVIRKHGGEIRYEAQEDGSNFVFTLPSGLAASTDLVLPTEPLQSQMAAVR